jgi:hypothetical protein
MIIVNNIYKMLADDSEPIYLNEEQEIDSCPVICFEERDDDDNFDSIDTRLFVTYDSVSQAYILNGKRIDVVSKRGRNKTNFQPFMFCAKDSSDIADFILLTFSKNSKMSYTLFNYNNLPEDACDMTYDFMEKNMDKKYEIAAFDNVLIRRAMIKRVVRMSRVMYN